MNQKEKASVRYKIMTRVTEYIYRDVIARRDEIISDIHTRNCILWDTEGDNEAAFADSFYYEGKKWPENLEHYRLTLKLNDKLVPEMVEFMNWYRPIVEQEQPLVETFIRKVLNYSDDLVFNIGLFPSSLHDCIRSVVHVEGMVWTTKDIKEVAAIIGVKEKVVRAVTFRLMANLVGA